MSKHEVLVYQVDNLTDWPDSNNLQEIRIEGFICAVRKGDYKIGDLIIYYEPDTIVPDTEEFAFLKGHRRIKARKIRGTYSQGLIMPAPPGSKAGDNVWGQVGAIRWEPELHTNTGGSRPAGCSVPSGLQAQAPSGVFPTYDIENWRKYGRHYLIPGEEVICTEKVHGSFFRAIHQDGELHIGSHHTWKKSGGLRDKEYQTKKSELNLRKENGEDVDFNELQRLSMWWQVAEDNEWLQTFCKIYMGIAIYGEIFGQVQDLKYGATEQNPYMLRVFDLWNSINQRYLEVDDSRWNDIPQENKVPLLYRGPYDSDMVEQLAEGQSTIASHIREGCVVKTIPERYEHKFGRCIFKCVGSGYLSRP